MSEIHPQPGRLFAGGLLMLLAAAAPAHTPPDAARLYFGNLSDGDRVASPVRIEFAIDHYKIIPASASGRLRHQGGHVHLLIDRDELPAFDRPIPREPGIIHYDGGETAAEVALPPGRHTLQLLLGDEEHEPHAPPLYSPKISITVSD